VRARSGRAPRSAGHAREHLPCRKDTPAGQAASARRRLKRSITVFFTAHRSAAISTGRSRFNRRARGSLEYGTQPEGGQMAKIDDPQKLFEYELGMALGAERKVRT